MTGGGSLSSSQSIAEVNPGDGADFVSKFNTYAGKRRIVLPSGVYVLPSPLIVPNTGADSRTIIIEGSGASYRVAAETQYGTVIKGSAGCADTAMIKGADVAASSIKLSMRDIRFEPTGVEKYVLDYTGFKPWFERCYFNGNLRAYVGSEGFIYGSTSGDKASPGWFDDIGMYVSSKQYAPLTIKGEDINAGRIYINLMAAACDTALRMEPTLTTNLDHIEVYISGGKNPVNLIQFAGYYSVKVGTLFVTHDAGAFVSDAILKASTRSGTLIMDKMVDSCQPVTGHPTYNTLCSPDGVTPGRVNITEYTKRLDFGGGTFQPGAAYAEFQSPDHRISVDVSHFTRAKIMTKGGCATAGTKGACIYNRTNTALLAEATWTDTDTALYHDGAWTDITALTGLKELSLYAKTPGAAQDFVFGSSMYHVLQLAGFR
jgi:hypothetical protein